ncbi:hypothetical protein ACFYWY_19000 [Streptomyces sp. NPDC002870]|uniref:DUF6414 family protein n=1 Tax=Streptomyces sp. NPDC002870 TaxID=3364666 RepID=UPI0036C072FF
MREFLYVDTDKVRAMLAQLDGGVAEEEHETDRTEKRSTVGPRTLAQHFQGTGNERSTHKSMGDSTFPMLEAALESESLLKDISEEAADITQWNSGELRRTTPPGSLVRISAPGSLFDSRYMASVFAGFAAANLGLQGISGPPAQRVVPPGKKKQQSPRPRGSDATPLQPQLEDMIPDFVMSDDEGGTLDGFSMRAMVRVARGMYTPGLHMNLSPVESADPLISCRLQEGRQYLDTEADILFARYGTDVQEWTLVGSVGHYGSQDTTLPDPDFVDRNGVVSRGAFSSYINATLRHVGGLGFLDMPKYPGLSMIPFAVYRSIPRFPGALVAST